MTLSVLATQLIAIVLLGPALFLLAGAALIYWAKRSSGPVELDHLLPEWRSGFFDDGTESLGRFVMAEWNEATQRITVDLKAMSRLPFWLQRFILEEELAHAGYASFDHLDAAVYSGRAFPRTRGELYAKTRAFVRMISRPVMRVVQAAFAIVTLFALSGFQNRSISENWLGMYISRYWFSAASLFPSRGLFLIGWFSGLQVQPVPKARQRF